MTWARRLVLGVLGVAMIAVGVDHFVNPAPFDRIVPAWLPAPHALVLVSGLFEVLGGIGVLVPRTRRLAGWGLIALFVAVFPANINMAVNQIQLTPTDHLPVWAMWARLPFQVVFIALTYWCTQGEPTRA